MYLTATALSEAETNVLSAFCSFCFCAPWPERTQDILYLPALWYHRVSQRGITVAVNYWHDMQFDHKYVYYRFLETLAPKLREGVVCRPPGGVGRGGSSRRPSESPEARVEQGVSVGGGEEERVEEDR